MELSDVYLVIRNLNCTVERASKSLENVDEILKTMAVLLESMNRILEKWDEDERQEIENKKTMMKGD